MHFSTRIIERPDMAKIKRNIDFGTAMGLTETAKQGQAAVVGALKGTFTLRGNWWQQSNRFGIRVKIAKRDDLESGVRTNADWIEPHEKGGAKRGRGGRLAVPTDQVRRNKRQIIPRGQRPKALRDKTFILQTRRGPVIAQRMQRGPRKGLVVLYGLEGSVRIKKQSTFFEPIQKVVDRRLVRNIRNGVDKALRTMR